MPNSSATEKGASSSGGEALPFSFRDYDVAWLGRCALRVDGSQLMKRPPSNILLQRQIDFLFMNLSELANVSGGGLSSSALSQLASLKTVSCNLNAHMKFKHDEASHHAEIHFKKLETLGVALNAGIEAKRRICLDAITQRMKTLDEASQQAKAMAANATDMYAQAREAVDVATKQFETADDRFNLLDGYVRQAQLEISADIDRYRQCVISPSENIMLELDDFRIRIATLEGSRYAQLNSAVRNEGERGRANLCREARSRSSSTSSVSQRIHSRLVNNPSSTESTFAAAVLEGIASTDALKRTIVASDTLNLCSELGSSACDAGRAGLTFGEIAANTAKNLAIAELLRD